MCDQIFNYEVCVYRKHIFGKTRYLGLKKKSKTGLR